MNLIQIWHTAEKPTIIQALEEETRAFYNDYNHVYISDPEELLSQDYGHPNLTPDNLHQFWKRLETCDGSGKPYAVQADLLKLLAILKYGGMYVDSDMFPIRRLPVQKYHFAVSNDIGVIGEHLIVAPQDDYYIKGIAVSFTKTRIQYKIASMNLTHWIPRFKLEQYVHSLPVTISHFRETTENQRYALNEHSLFSHIWYRNFDYDFFKLLNTRKSWLNSNG